MSVFNKVIKHVEQNKTRHLKAVIADNKRKLSQIQKVTKKSLISQ